MKICRFLFLISLIGAFGNTAQAVELCGNLKQGEIVFGNAGTGNEVYFNGEKIFTDDKGNFLLAWGRDESNKQSLAIKNANGKTDNYELEISPTKWNVQNIKGVPPRKVSPSDADLAAINKENKLLKKALKAKTSDTFWRGGFIYPVEGRISGEFGGQRIMNNVPKNPHRGMDIAAKEGTEVKAAADGVVVLAYPNLFYSGNLIVIDHGFGLQTIYAHLSQINVKLNDKIKQGDVIGLVGKTGRATGPHLHFGASLRDVRFNPQSLLDMNSNLQKCFTL